MSKCEIPSASFEPPHGCCSEVTAMLKPTCNVVLTEHREAMITPSHLWQPHHNPLITASDGARIDGRRTIPTQGVVLCSWG